jgi:hypothetical protein
MKQKYTLIALVVYALVIILPPLIQGYSYPNIGSDTAAHEAILDNIKIDSPAFSSPDIRYGSYYAVGYPLDIISRLTSASKDTLFFWFNYVSLIAIGFGLFFIFKNLISLTAGMMALLIPIFTSYGILLLFYSGVIFNLLNVALILPFIVYFFVRWMTTKKKRYIIGIVLLSILFSIFHTSGIYLPFIAIIGFVIYLIYKAVKRQPVPKKQILIALILGLCGIVAYIFSPISISSLVNAQKVELVGFPFKWGFPLLEESLIYYMSPILSGVILITIVILGNYKKVPTNERLALAAFAIPCLAMLPIIMSGWSPQPFRQGLDFAILLSIEAVALVGVAIKKAENPRIMLIFLVVLSAMGAMGNIYNWLGRYNSALERVDLEAITYVNNLDGYQFSCSDNVDHQIYSRFVNKKYISEDGDIYLIRNEPMRSKVVLSQGNELDNSERIFLKEFEENGIEILIYR